MNVHAAGDMADLPSGAVTFLFTDIEGSTRLVKLLRERYGEVLQEHQRLLRAAFEAHRGYEVDTQGDSFFVAFSSARDALLAAVEGQLAISSHSWPEGVQIKVRMGLHTGQATATGGRYTGLAVHRAARIGAAGYGGQILISQATQTLLEDEEEDLHIHLRDLGEQQLKDLDRPVRIYQAAADGLPLEFPPLRGAAEPGHAAEAPIESVVVATSRRGRSRCPRPGRRARGSCGPRLAGLIGRAGRCQSQRGRCHRSCDERDRRRGPGRDPARADCRQRRVHLGREPGRIGRSHGSIRLSARPWPPSRSTTRRRPASPSAAAVSGSVTGLSGQVSRVDEQFNRVTSSIDVATRTARTGVVAFGDGRRLGCVRRLDDRADRPDGR